MDPRVRKLSGSLGILSRERRLLAWAVAILGLPALTWLLTAVSNRLGLHNVLLLYLLTAVTVGAIGGALPALVTAVAGFLLANWFFTEPVGTLMVADPDHLVSIFVFLVVALAVGLLVGLSTRRSAEAHLARAHAEALASVASQRPVLAAEGEGLLSPLVEVFSLTAASVLRREGTGWATLAWAGEREIKVPRDGSEVIELTDETSLILLGGRLSGDDRVVLRAFANQIVLAAEREELEREAQAAEAMVATDRLRNALLDTVSHDLRTPLATIKASLTSLLETGVEWTPSETQLFLREAIDQAERLNRMVGRLLDASRLQVGAMHVFFRAVGLDEIVSAASSSLGAASGRVVVDISDSLPQIETDPDLLERVVANLIENALAWSPPDRPVQVSASAADGRVRLRISDRGPGIPDGFRDLVFEPFHRLGQAGRNEGVGLGLAVSRGLLDAMGRTLTIEDTPGGGTTMVIELKAAALKENPVGLG